MKVIFMGTPNFSVNVLDKINKEHEVTLVVTQPDSYNYRKKVSVYSPVKEYALAHNLKVFQPEKLKEEMDVILNTPCDIIVTAAYGQFVPSKLLEYPKYKAINVHGSLLPKYRGGAPIQRAIINGEKVTGITIMYMAKKMDAGDIIKKEKLEILDSDNQETLFNKLSILGSNMILGVLEKIEKGKVERTPQDESEATFSYNLTKEDELINFNKDARSVFNQIRGLNPNPGAYFVIENIPIKVYNSRVEDKVSTYGEGVISGVYKDHFEVTCAKGSVVSILEVQLPSKNKMSARDFLNGQGKKIIEVGKKIGE